MRTAIEKFREASRGARLAAFYFAGHGVTWDKQTYVVPVDADLSDPSKVLDLVRVPSIGGAMKEATNRLLVFDSCRNNPADGWRQREAKAQAKIDAADAVAGALSEANTLTLFSTASGATALDGPAGENSPFAAALLRQLDSPSVDLQALPTKLRRDLLLATQCRQLAWDINTYASPYALQGAGKASALPAVRHDPSTIVELHKAYAFASQNGLVLPPGLVAYRAAVNTPDARLIGSYKYESTSQVTPTSMYRTQALLIVLSVPGGNSAEVIIAYKNWRLAGGNRWSYVSADKTDGTISYPNADEYVRHEFKWRDADSGAYTGKPNAGAFYSSPFTRLDG
jgi:hypothetical protein